jgi:putative nucleotidyltransferase with HDIG domain
VGLTDDVNPIPLLGDAQLIRRVRGELADLTWPVGLYLCAVVGIAGGLAAVLVVSGERVGSPVVVTSLAVVAALSERGRILLRGGDLKVSISLFPSAFAAVLFGPVAGMIVFGASAVGLAMPLLGRVTYVANRALIGASAGGAAAGIALVAPGGVGEIIAAATAAALTAEFADACFTSLTFALRGLGRWRDAAGDLFPVIATSSLFYSPVVAMLVLAYRDVSPWTLPLFFAPALAAQRWFLLYQDQRRLTVDLQTVNEQLKAANLSFAKGLIATLEARDPYTAGHSGKVAIFASDIAQRMGLDQEQIELAYLCGLVHDIGKIGLAAGLLEKPGALTLEERREMQRHSEIGERILANVDTYAEVAGVVRHHHERIDGQGYPDGLADTAIPLLSRIIAVADAYDAMISDRPYRDAMPSRVARLRLAQAVETQFDTTVVAAFEAILASSDEEYRSGHGSWFTPVAYEAEVVDASSELSTADAEEAALAS